MEGTTWDNLGRLHFLWRLQQEEPLKRPRYWFGSKLSLMYFIYCRLHGWHFLGKQIDFPDLMNFFCLETVRQSNNCNPMVVIKLGCLILFLSHEISHQRFCLKSADEINCKKPFQRGITETRGCTPVGKRWEVNGATLQCSCQENPMDGGAWRATVHGVAMSRTWLCEFTFTFPFHALEKEMATHSSVLAWRIPGTGEPGGRPSMGSHNFRHDWSDLAAVSSSKGKEWHLSI